MAKYLIFGDVHLGPPPSSCTDTYLEDLFDLLLQCGALACEHNVRAAVIAGDLFNLKAPTRTSHALMKSLIDILRTFRCTVWLVPGNHDMQHDRIESLDETQPAGVLLSSGAVELLEGWAPEEPLYGVPWLQGYGAYTEESDTAVGRALADWRGPKSHALVVAHAPLYPPGFELEYEFFPAERWAEAMGGQGSCYYGHVHERHGVWHAGGVTFCNPGALSRGSLHEHNLTRMPAVAIWDSADGQFTEIPLNAKPPEQVFRLAEKQQATDMTGRLEEFLTSVGSATLEVMSVESVESHIRGLGLSEADTTFALELLMEAVNVS